MASSPRDDAYEVWAKISRSVHRMFDETDAYEPENKFEMHTAKDQLMVYKTITELVIKYSQSDDNEIELYIDPNFLAITAEQIAGDA